jgi:hypothetical protein
MLELKKMAARDDGFVDITYEASHTLPERGGTHLELDVVLTQNRRMGKTWVKVALAPELSTLDPDVALDKLAEWAERLALTLRHRGPATSVAVSFDSPQSTDDKD